MMKVQLMLITTLALAVASPAEDPQGRYFPDNSGRYVHNSNEGRYIPDASGLYRHDGTGGYADDGSGRYSGQKDIYQGSKFGSGGFGGSGSGRFGSGNLVGANTFQSPKIAVRPNPNSGFGSQASATSPIGARAGGYRSGQYNDEGKWKIIRQVGDVDIDGYHWDYLTENGINAEETGKVYNQGTANEALRANGFFTYTGPDNVVYHIQYTADENGFVAQGDHIPTPPPVPEAIQRSLAYQRSLGQL